jgi:hypothetical protein
MDSYERHSSTVCCNVKKFIFFLKSCVFSSFLNDSATYYTALLPYYLHFFFLNICPTELGLKITCIIIMPKFYSNLPMFIFMQHTISIMYIHGNGSIFNVFNNTLQEVFLPTLLINHRTFFCTMKIFLLSPSPPQNSMPYLKCKWKYTKYILPQIYTIVLPLSYCMT